MASTSATYALPLDSSLHIHPQHGRAHHHHHYSNSLLPDRSPSWSSNHNGAALKKAHSHGSLQAPAPAPFAPPAQSSNTSTDAALMKGRPSLRPRGESDLGRPASAGSVETSSGYGFPPVGKHAEDAAYVTIPRLNCAFGLANGPLGPLTRPLPSSRVRWFLCPTFWHHWPSPRARNPPPQTHRPIPLSTGYALQCRMRSPPHTLPCHRIAHHFSKRAFSPPGRSCSPRSWPKPGRMLQVSTGEEQSMRRRESRRALWDRLRNWS